MMSSSSPHAHTRFSTRTRNRVHSDETYSPEYNERHPNFPYSALHPPPPEWELYDIPDKTHLRNRALDLATFKKLVRHHTWGFDVVIGDRKTKERLLQVLKRIVYNQEASLRPTWHEFVSRDCDAGPRLLRRSYDALRISRRFPDGVPGQPLRWGGVMPKDTPATAGLGQGASMATGSGTMSGSGLNEIASQGYAMNSMQPPSLVNANGNNMYGASPYMSTLNDSPNPTFMYDQRHVANTITPVFPNPPTPMSISFSTPPLLHSQLPPTNLPLRLAVSGEIPHFTLSQTGTLYPTCGRGPVSLSAPCDPVSCTILAGLLLQLTPPPTFPNQPSPLNSVESAFFTALSIPWSTLPDSISSARLNEFRTVCREYVDGVYKASNPLAAINGERRLIPLSPYNVWSISTISVPGVQTRFLEDAKGCLCQNQNQCPDQNLNRSTEGMKLVKKSYITTDALDGTGREVDLDSSVRRFFTCKRALKCSNCGSDNAVVLKRKFENVPQILAIRPDPRVLFKRHSSDIIDVEYLSTADRVYRAKYRWVGGIYPIDTKTQTPAQQQQLAQNGQRASYKLFWADRNNTLGAVDSGALRVYDATQLSGTIVGNVQVPTSGLGERVPAKWWAGCLVKESSPMLFYEKIEDTGNEARALDLGQSPLLQTELQPLSQESEVNILRENPSRGASLAPSQHPNALGNLQNASNINIDPNVQLSPTPLHWNSFKPAIPDPNLRRGSGLDSDVFDNIFAHPSHFANSSSPDIQGNNVGDNGNVIGWVSHPESQPSSSTGTTTSNFPDSGMFMDSYLNMDFGIEATQLGSLDFGPDSDSNSIPSTYHSLPEVTSSSDILSAATTIANTSSSVPTTTAGTGAPTVDPQLAISDTKPGTTTIPTAILPASTSIPDDINWTLDFTGATNGSTTHPNSMSSAVTAPTTTAPKSDSPLAQSYNAFDVSLDAYNESLASNTTVDAKLSIAGTTPAAKPHPDLVPNPFSITTTAPVTTTSTGRNYLPPNALTLSRKRTLPRSPSPRSLADGACEKRVKL